MLYSFPLFSPPLSSNAAKKAHREKGWIQDWGVIIFYRQSSNTKLKGKPGTRSHLKKYLLTRCLPKQGCLLKQATLGPHSLFRIRDPALKRSRKSLWFRNWVLVPPPTLICYAIFNKLLSSLDLLCKQEGIGLPWASHEVIWEHFVNDKALSLYPFIYLVTCHLENAVKLRVHHLRSSRPSWWLALGMTFSSTSV